MLNDPTGAGGALTIVPTRQRAETSPGPSHPSLLVCPAPRFQKVAAQRSLVPGLACNGWQISCQKTGIGPPGSRFRYWHARLRLGCRDASLWLDRYSRLCRDCDGAACHAVRLIDLYLFIHWLEHSTVAPDFDHFLVGLDNARCNAMTFPSVASLQPAKKEALACAFDSLVAHAYRPWPPETPRWKGVRRRRR